MYIICKFSLDPLYNCCHHTIFFQKNIFIETERKKTREKREIDGHIKGRTDGRADGQTDREGMAEKDRGKQF